MLNITKYTNCLETMINKTLNVHIYCFKAIHKCEFVTIKLIETYVYMYVYYVILDNAQNVFN